MIGVGDDVVYIGDNGNVPAGFDPPDVRLVPGAIYRVTSCSHDGTECPDCGSDTWLQVDGCGEFDEYCICEFARPKRRSLTEWLSQKTKFEEPKRVGENA